jgi:hypothetical protein
LEQKNSRLEAELISLQIHSVPEAELQHDALHQSQEQDRQASLLLSIATVANLLLRSPNYATVLPNVVRLLGKAVGSDRY